MKRSSDRILTTHVGSLIRPLALLDHLRARQSGKGFDEAAYQRCLTESVADVVRGLPDGDHLGVGRGVLIGFAAVAPRADHLAVQHRDRADGHVLVGQRAAGFVQGQAHPGSIVHSAGDYTIGRRERIEGSWAAGGQR